MTLRRSGISALRRTARPRFPRLRRRLRSGVSVEIACAGRLADIRADWTDLLRRAAEPNVFMDPALIARRARRRARRRISRAARVENVGGREQLTGIWTFAVGRPRRSVLPMPVMRVPAFAHGYLATPVIDRDCLDETLDAMLDCIAASSVLPKIMSLDTMGTGGPTYEALLRVLAARGSAPCVFEQVQRPKLASDARRQGLSRKGAVRLDPEEAAPAPAEALRKGHPHLLGRDRAASGPPGGRGIPGDGSLGLEGPPGHGAGQQRNRCGVHARRDRRRSPSTAAPPSIRSISTASR